MLFQPARYMGLKPAGAQNAFGYPKLSMNFCPRQATSAGAKVVLRRVAEVLKNDLYFNVLQAKYGYAITCHKSQGGESENAFVDFKVYIGKLSKGFFRWAYTAIARGSGNPLPARMTRSYKLS